MLFLYGNFTRVTTCYSRLQLRNIFYGELISAFKRICWLLTPGFSSPICSGGLLLITSRHYHLMLSVPA